MATQTQKTKSNSTPKGSAPKAGPLGLQKQSVVASRTIYGHKAQSANSAQTRVRASGAEGEIQPSTPDHVPVFNPNRWLWDFEAEKPVRMSRPSGPVRKRSSNQMMMWNLISSVIDFLFVGLISFLFLWALGKVLDSSVRNTLMGLWRISPTGTFILFYSFLWIYHVAGPALFSYTPGQWACQITRTPQDLTFSWILKATLRLVFLFMTGFMILPLFSWASGTDLEASLSGLKLQERK